MEYINFARYSEGKTNNYIYISVVWNMKYINLARYSEEKTNNFIYIYIYIYVCCI